MPKFLIAKIFLILLFLIIFYFGIAALKSAKSDREGISSIAMRIPSVIGSRF